jgi:hypothetical protein
VTLMTFCYGQFPYADFADQNEVAPLVLHVIIDSPPPALSSDNFDPELVDLVSMW